MQAMAVTVRQCEISSRVFSPVAGGLPVLWLKIARWERGPRVERRTNAGAASIELELVQDFSHQQYYSEISGVLVLFQG